MKKMPSDDALWMRRNLTWVEIAEEYQMDANWLSFVAKKRGFKRNSAGQLLIAPCKQCDRKRLRGNLEPNRVCEACRGTENRDQPWWPDYQEARRKFLERMRQRGLRSGDIEPPS